MKEYDQIFHKEINAILTKLYEEPINPQGYDKRAVVQTDYQYVQFLVQHDLVKQLKGAGNGKYSLILRRNGHLVFEKYGSWQTYYDKVIRKQEKINNAKGLATRFWWLPIVISIVALLGSLYAIFCN